MMLPGTSHTSEQLAITSKSMQLTLLQESSARWLRERLTQAVRHDPFGRSNPSLSD